MSCARVRNVVAMLGPRNRQGASCSSRITTARRGPGASDDGIGVATLLEVGSILRTSAQAAGHPAVQRRRGTRSDRRTRLSRDPLSRNVDSLINFEARGVRGPAPCSRPAARTARDRRSSPRAAHHPVANSLSTDVYRLMPNYTDVNSFSERGWLTLNFAIDRQRNALSLARRRSGGARPATPPAHGRPGACAVAGAANGAAASQRRRRIFMDVAGRTLISLPHDRRGGPADRAALRLRRDRLAPRRVVRGVAVAARHFGRFSRRSRGLRWRVIGAVSRTASSGARSRFGRHLAAYASVILAAAVLLATFGRRDRIRSFALLSGSRPSSSAGIGLVAPGGIIFFLFPPLLVLIGIVATRWWAPAERSEPWPRSSCSI